MWNSLLELQPLPLTLHMHLYLWSDHRTNGVRWCLHTSNKLLLLRWFKFLLLLTNSLQNRITLLLVLKLLQSTKLTPCFFFFLLEKVEISNYNKCKLLIFTQKIKEPLNTHSQHYCSLVIFFFFFLKLVQISCYIY